MGVPQSLDGLYIMENPTKIGALGYWYLHFRNLHIHSTFLSMQRTKMKHNWIWEIHRADKTRKGSIDRNLLGTWST